jgi:hypothetical protein
MIHALLFLAVLTPADDAKGKPAEVIDIKGLWNVSALSSNAGLKSFKGVTLKIGEKEVSWSDAIQPVFTSAGKGVIKFDAKSNPKTFELTVGKKVYTGFYKADIAGGGKEEYAYLFISEPGGKFTKEFMSKPNPFDELDGFKGARIVLLRKRK